MKAKFSLFPQSKSRSSSRAQAMVEFAIALPVLLYLLFGIIEISRMVFMYAMVVNASRDAVRYASAFGKSDDGYRKYSYCAGIRTVAKQSGFFLNLSTNPTTGSIKITYDSGPSTSPVVTEVSTGNACDASSGEDADVVNTVTSEDRVTVTITASYKPIVPLIPISPKTFTSKSSRTILGEVHLEN